MNEIWKDIKEYEGLYQVSNYGRIKSLDKIDKLGRKVAPRLLKTRFEGKDKNYIHCCLNKNGISKEYKVHRLVAEAFLNKQDFKCMPYEDKNTIDLKKLHVNHKDENPSNNNVKNLEWCTDSYNKAYSYAKKINQYDLDGNFIKQWDSIHEAQITLKINKSGIIACCKGRSKTYKGYKWKYA